MRKILIIEDEPNIRELVSYNLKAGGFLSLEAEDGISGMEMVETQKPDLILLDIMLPGKDGYEICKELRSAGNKTPIIMMTAKTDEIDKVLGLEFGADDYISKPFGVRELMARIKAVLRRFEGNVGEEPAGEILTVDEMSIDISRHEVTVEGRKVELTMKEFELLTFLARNRGRAFSRDELLDKVWGINYLGESRTVDVHIRHLRKKMSLLEDEDKYIETIRGKGYKMK
jgi:two-component system, OmpR family, alkaline phosphatase synthesis response regulator PhoP